ncbi:MAG: DUF1232 domain-containing protein [Geminicoccaceae bacterium]|nr:DUF1232 domain-containing protein [Geminicoccaceae bacterium]
MTNALQTLPEPAGAPDPRRFWSKVKRVAAHVPFAEDLAAAYYCALDDATPRHVKGMLFGAVAYFILPFDMIPDVIAGLGFTDDATVLATVITLFSRHIRDDHRRMAREKLERLRQCRG